MKTQFHSKICRFLLTKDGNSYVYREDNQDVIRYSKKDAENFINSISECLKLAGYTISILE